MKNEVNTFAFKLASKNNGASSKWTVREGLSVAGCTTTRGGEPRETIRRPPPSPPVLDGGVYC